MLDRQIFRGVLLTAALCAGFVYAQNDPDALLRQAQAKVMESIAKLPKYTCVQTIRRSRFDSFYGSGKKGCGEQENLWLAWTDQLKLDVTISSAGEIFSWAGAREFQSTDVQTIAGNGLTSTGDFGHFLKTVFGGDGVQYQSLGIERENGATLAVFEYNVPAAASRYEIRLSARPGDVATLAYRGKFWIDPERAELRRMSIAVVQTPRRSETCRIETTIEYHRVPIAGSQLVLPQLTLLKLWDSDGSRFENRTTYGACRAFQSESVLRNEVDAGTPVAPANPEDVFSIPPGIHLRIVLSSRINGETAFAGDTIQGQIPEPLRSRDGKIFAPQGAIVSGRIVRLEHHVLPSHYFTVGLRFDMLRVNGHEHPLQLKGAGIFVFPTEQLLLDEGFVSEWTTTK